MTTFAPRHMQRRLAELEELTRDAWAHYSYATSELQGSEYEEAEYESWAELQATLRALESERDELMAVAPYPA